MKKAKTIIHDELRPEYDLKNLRVRKFGTARKQFGNFVKLEPNVAAIFLDAASVNEVLRYLIRVTKENSPGPSRTGNDIQHSASNNYYSAIS